MEIIKMVGKLKKYSLCKSSLKFSASLVFHLAVVLNQVHRKIYASDDEAIQKNSNLFNDEFVSKKYFIDKSDFLEVLFKDGHHKRHFITCPAGFGKTSNLQMVQKFCQLEFDDNTWKESAAYKFFDKMRIAQNQNISANHLARHPVIYLDLNCSFISETDKTVEYTMIEINRQLFSSYKRYVTRIEQYYSETERRKNLTAEFQRWLNSSISGTMGDNFRENFINIFQTFSTVFESDIVLLIDNHDYHVNPKFKNIQRRIEAAHKSFHDALIGIIKTYKDRMHLVITGISSISFYKHRLNEFVDHFNFVADTEYAPYFGLIESEVQELFERYNTQESERMYVRKFYDSYKTSIHRYNTFHISNYFANRIKKTSSVTLRDANIRLNQSSDYIRLFLKHPNYLEDVAKLLKHCSIVDSFNKTYNVDDLQKFDDLSRKDFNNIRSYDIGFLYTMSFEHGFIGRAKDGAYIIPNNEIKRFFETDLRHYFETTLKVNITQLGIEFLDILYKTANKTGDISNQLKPLLETAYQKLQPIAGSRPNSVMNFTYHSILHMAALTNEEMTVIDDYPQPVSHHQSEANFIRRCVTLITGAGVAVIFKITHDQSAKIAMEQAMTYAYQSPDVRYLKYVGINVDSYGYLDIAHCPKSYLLQKGEKDVSEEIEKFTINFENVILNQEQELQQQNQNQQEQNEQ